MSMPIYPNSNEFQLVEDVDTSMLLQLDTAIQAHHTILSNMWHDLAYQHQTVYVLDFQEIYSYIFPKNVDAEDTVTVSYVLDNLDAPFLLLTGTWYELLHKVKQILGNTNIITNILEVINQEGVDAQSFAELKDFILYGKDRVFSDANSFNSSLKLLSKNLAEALSEYEKPFTKLVELLNKPNHITLEQLTDDYGEIEFDQDLVDDFHEALNIFRPRGVEHSNFADAANLASIVSIRRFMNNRMNQIARKKLSRIYLLSHSQTILINLDHWAADKLGEVGSKLSRTPNELMYQMLLKQKTPKQTREAIKKRLEICEGASAFIRDKVDEIITYEEEYPGTLKLISNILPDSDILETVKSLNGDSYVEIDAFLKYVHDPIIREIDDVKRLNDVIRDNKKNRNEFVDGNLFFGIDEVSQAEMKIISLWNDIQNKFSLRLKDIRMKFEEDKITDTDYVRATIITKKTKQIAFSLENYENFFSAYWSTDIGLAQFLSSVQTSIRELIKSTKTQVNISNLDCVVLLVTNKQVYEIPFLLLDLGRKPFVEIQELESTEALFFIRIATIWGDFCYEIEPTTTNQPLYTGFISRYQLTDNICSMFFRSTSHPTLVPRLLRKYVQRYMKNYPHYRELPKR